ncbi:uncharacterized protein LOC144343669 [Saccoglossus kowalevskii]
MNKDCDDKTPDVTHTMSWKRTACGSGFSISLFILIFSLFYLESTTKSSKHHIIPMFHKTPVIHRKPINLPLPVNVTITPHNVTGDSDKQGEKYGYLQPKNETVVPNIAHFIWFSCHMFKFENLISILSAHRIMQAERILFHTDCEPESKWWKQAKLLIPVLEVVQKTPPTEVFGKTLNPIWPHQAADVARLHILREMGGVSFDINTFIVAPLEPLRFYDYVVAIPVEKHLNYSIILANRDAEFLQYHNESYKDYDIFCKSCTTVKRLHEVTSAYINAVHIEQASMTTPSVADWRSLFNRKYDWQNEHFTIPVWMDKYMGDTELEDITPENIQQLDTAFGEMCRYIYYGSPDLIQ